MKTITVEHPATDFLALLDQARSEDIIVRLADGSEFILAAIDAFEDEIVQMRKNAALMALLAERAQEPATIALEDLKTELGLE
jgi:hypothetical protein